MLLNIFFVVGQVDATILTPFFTSHYKL